MTERLERAWFTFVPANGIGSMPREKLLQ